MSPPGPIARRSCKVNRLRELITSYVQRHGGALHALPALAAAVVRTLRQGGLEALRQKALAYAARINASAHRARSIPTLKALHEALPGSPEAALRQRLFQGMLTPEHRPACIVDHTLGGGANAYAAQLREAYLADDRAVLLLVWDMHARVIVATATWRQEHLCFTAASLDAFLHPAFSLQTIFINELTLWSEGDAPSLQAMPELLRTIQALGQTHAATLLFAWHDYLAICPQYTLTGLGDQYCGIPTNSRECAPCLASMETGHGRKPKDFSLDSWRASWQRFFDACDELRFFSHASRHIAERCFTFREGQVRVLPHTPLVQWTRSYELPKDGPMSIAVVGNISRAKGALIVRDLAAMLAPEVRLTVIGSMDASVPLPAHVTVTGPYQREQLPELLAHHRVTVGLIPSVWPETFNYVALECQSLGLPMVCFNLGAPAERLAAWEYGRVAEEMTAARALRALQALDAERLG